MERGDTVPLAYICPYSTTGADSPEAVIVWLVGFSVVAWLLLVSLSVTAVIVASGRRTNTIHRSELLPLSPVTLVSEPVSIL